MTRKRFELHRLSILLLLLVALVLPFVFTTPFMRHLSILVLMWATLGSAWNILVGYAGQVSLGHAFFFGIGAYTTTILFAKFGVIPILGIWIGLAIAVFFAFILGYPLFRLSGFYFSIATVALGEIAWILFTNWDWAGGARGLFVPMKGNAPLYLQFTSKVPYYYVILGLFIVTILISARIEENRAGYYFRAIRDESEAALSLGVNIHLYKRYAYMFSAGLVALAGGFFANYILYIDPDSVFLAKISLQVCLVTVLGGIGYLWGPLVGSILLIPVSEFARVRLSGAGRALDLLLYGILIVVIAVFEPNGLIGLYRRIRTSMSSRMHKGTELSSKIMSGAKEGMRG